MRVKNFFKTIFIFFLLVSISGVVGCRTTQIRQPEFSVQAKTQKEVGVSYKGCA